MRHAVSTPQPSTNPVKFAEPRPFSDPEAAVRKLIEIANTAEPVQDARIYIERVNGPFLAAGGSPAEYRAGIERAIAKGWLWRHGARSIGQRSQGRSLEPPAIPTTLQASLLARLGASAVIELTGLRTP